jgi:long-chain acyl-CoA synthetase
MTNQDLQLDYISIEEAGTLYGLFKTRLARHPDSIAYRSYSAKTQNWYDTTWQEIADQVARWQTALAKEDLAPGDRVALNLRNAKEWIIFDQAAMGLGLIVVPLYPDDRPDNIAYILQDADVKCLFLQNVHQWKRIQPALTEEHHLTRIIINQDDETPLSDHAVYLGDWLPASGDELTDWDGNPHQLASIIYTSGTTGRPKGVMLSHHNMLSVAKGGLDYLNIYPHDLFLSFLPLSHTLERTVGYYLPIMSGSTVAFSRGIPQLADDMLTIKPTVLVAVPRIFERIYGRLSAQLEQKSFFAKWLFKSAAKTGWTKFNYQQGRGRYQLSFLMKPLFDKLVSSKVMARLGGRLRIAISGGAALPSHASELFIGLGLNLLQGYGLTETSPVISVNESDNNKPNSVGRPIPGVHVKIGNNDELLVRGPGNMLGYWNNHKATAQVVNAEGWLRTGDQARIEDSGHIFITGRIKDILVMSNGEKVPPGDMEAALLSEEHFDQALVLGEGESYLTALIVLNGDLWPGLAQQLSLDPLDKASLKSKALQQWAIQQCRSKLADFPAYAKIRRVAMTLEPWTPENGLMTPTMKVKRVKVLEHHQSDVTELYD